MKTISMLTQLLSNSVPTVLPPVVLEKREGIIHEGQIKCSELCHPSESQQQPQSVRSWRLAAAGSVGCLQLWVIKL